MKVFSFLSFHALHIKQHSLREDVKGTLTHLLLWSKKANKNRGKTGEMLPYCPKTHFRFNYILSNCTSIHLKKGPNALRNDIFFCLFSKEGRGKSSADDSSRNACRRSSLAQHDNMVVQIFAMYPLLLFFLATSSFFFIKFIILAGLFKRWTEVRTIAAPKPSLLELLLCFSSFSVAAINLDVATLFSLVFLEDIHTCS